jgi:L-asparaginase II
LPINLPFVRPEPLSILVNRNGLCESSHQVDVAVCSAAGKIVLGLGDVEKIIFPRSAMKPLQAIALLEVLQRDKRAGQLSDTEIAVICSSHNGEMLHVDAVRNLLDKFDVDIDELICGAHCSMHQETMVTQVRNIEVPHQVHNNCSGKHAGMIILSKLLSDKTIGYEKLSCDAQQRILGTLESMTGVDLMRYTIGIDGCGAPVFSAPLGNWARAFALFAGGGELPDNRNNARLRIRKSIASNPFYIAGKDRSCSVVNSAYGEAITVKIGAEGVYAAAFHELGLGAMIKVRDGNTRGAEVALGAVIQTLGYQIYDTLSDFFQPTLRNWAGEVVGDITFGDFVT